MKELVEIPAHGQTLAMKSSILREFIKQLNINIEKFEEVSLNPPSAEEKKEAALNLGSELNKVNKVAQEKTKVNSTEIEPITFVNQANQELSTIFETYYNTNFEPELPANPTSKNDDSNNDPAEGSREDKEQYLATQFQIQQFVIPLIVERLNTCGKVDKHTQSIFYKSEEYTASLKLENDLHTLSLDRNSPDSEEIQEALLASKDINSEEYSITINNLTKEEFERFKILFQELQARHELNKQEVQNKDYDNEIG